MRNRAQRTGAFPRPRLHHVLAAVGVMVLSASVMAVGEPGKRGSVMITAEQRSNAIGNVERFDWAQEELETLKERVAPYMQMSPEELWALLPSQEMARDRRGYHHTHGCPRCLQEHAGEELGRGVWHIDRHQRPWQIQCERCETWYPKNDFASYYESALDEQGKFRLGEGDPKYLEPNPGVEGEARNWVDDGTGVRQSADEPVEVGSWAPDPGKEYQWFFVNHYVYKIWQDVPEAMLAMAELYTLTEDPEYAFRVGILLDRLGDLYPEMDSRPGRELGMMSGQKVGRIMNDRHEYGFVHIPIARAYDYVYDGLVDNQQLVEFVSDKTSRYELDSRNSWAEIEAHIRKNVLIDMAEYVRRPDAREGGGAFSRGVPHRTIATHAVALDEPEGLTKDWLDWAFDEDGGNLRYTLIEFMNRDGVNNNVGLGYTLATPQFMYDVADLLYHYDGYTEHNLYQDYGNFVNSAWAWRNVRVLNRTHFIVGDGGSSMSQSQRQMPTDMAVSAYRIYGDPDLAYEIYRSSDVRTHDHLIDGAVMDIYDADPEALLEQFYEDLDRSPPLESFNAGGYGQAVLQAPYHEDHHATGHHPADETARAAGIYYGRAMSPSHAHADRLSLHLIAHGEVMMPDLGNPRYKGRWPKRHGFTRHVVSHNTLMVNDRNMDACYSGKTRLFADADGVRVADVDGLGSGLSVRREESRIYEDMDTYRRNVVMVDVDEDRSYLLDLFWARGGHTHRLIQNAGGYEVTDSGLDLEAQQSGTLAGEDIEYGKFYDYDGDNYFDYRGSGFMYLDNVERGYPGSDPFWVDWKIEPRIVSHRSDDWQGHLRVHNETPVDEVVFADGEPSNGGPHTIRYMHRNRTGENLQSQFISVIEPYLDNPFIREVRVIERQEAGDVFGAAVEVQLENGQRDVLLVREEAGRLEAEGVELDGRVGVVRFDEDDEPLQMTLIAGDQLSANGQTLEPAQGPIRGRLVAFDDSNTLDVRLRLDQDLPKAASLEGQYIIFDNSEWADASYRIEAVTQARELSVGRKPLAERFVDPNDHSQGILYNLEPGDRFLIPQPATWQRE